MPKRKKLLMSVLNDLYTDPRVDKMCKTLTSFGFDVTLIGCRFKESPAIEKRNYQTKRLKLFFKKGPFFFTEYNVKLFLYLLFKQFDVLTANDLDTILPNFLASRIKRKEMVYDSHEYYCNMSSLTGRPKVRTFWQRIERFCFPKLKRVMTVSNSIAQKYIEQYGVDVKVVRNIPCQVHHKPTESRASLQLPEDKKIVIMQGNNIIKERGAEELIEALPLLNDDTILLFVGNVIDEIKLYVKTLQVDDRIIFAGRVTPEKLFAYTLHSDIGVSFGKNISDNHYFSLPNKLFEYIQAGIPVISSDFPERRAIITKYDVGMVLETFDAPSIAKAINTMTKDMALYQRYRQNCITAAKELTWENEESVIKDLYQGLLQTIMITE